MLHEEMISNERIEYFLHKYKNEITFAGSKHVQVKNALTIINNTKSNPEKLFVVEGIWAHDLLYKHKIEVKSFFFCPEFIFSNESKAIIDRIINSGVKSYILSKKVFLKVSEKDAPDGLLSICKLPQFTLDDFILKENSLIIIADGLEIPGNIGTIIRSIDGAGADGLIVCNKKARLTHPKILKGSLCSSFTVPIVEEDIDSIIEWLVYNKFNIVLTDTRANKQYYDLNYAGRIAIVLGSERYGISKKWYERSHTMVSIPMYGNCDSLNVAIAATIVIYEASLKQKGILQRQK